MSEEKGFKKEPGGISRRQFLRDAGIVVGGTAVGSTFFLSACGKEVEVTKTVTTTAPGITKTTTAADNTVTITKYTCPVDGREFDSLEALKAHYDETHEGSAGTAHNTITLTINGDLFKDILVKPHWTLRHLLHQELNFKEVKAMCVGRGAMWLMHCYYGRKTYTIVYDISCHLRWCSYRNISWHCCCRPPLD